MTRMPWAAALGAVCFSLSAFSAAWADYPLGQEPATLSVSSIKGFNLKTYGFVETDLIHDTVQGLGEEEDNSLLPKSNTYSGTHDRTQMSVRNSRLGFDLTMPQTPAGLKTGALIEMDFLGNQGVTTPPGTSPGMQSETNFFNNPAVRIRHAFLNLDYKSLNVKFGQTWSLLGWQPVYFPAEIIVQPGPGQLYRRFVQNRYTFTKPLDEDWLFEGAADYARPAESNSGLPIFQGGLRLSSKKYKAASMGGGSPAYMVPLSIALTGDLIPVRTAFGDVTGGGPALDFGVPVIPSKDGKSMSNTLIWVGEGSIGTGLGSVEYPGLGLGVTPPSTYPGGPALDAGIAGVDAFGNQDMISYEIFRTFLAYTFPGARWTASAGYAQVEGRNLNEFGGATGIAPKIQFGYADVFYNPCSYLRFGLELNRTRDTYNDANARFSADNRAQFSTFFIF